MKFIVLFLGKIPMAFCLTSRWPCASPATWSTATRFNTIQEATARAAQHWTAEQFTIEEIKY